MNKSYPLIQRTHLARIKSMPCVVCDSPPPSQAHHVKQDSAYHCMPLCADCHQGEHNGIHGGKAMWRVKKMDEVDALAKTIRLLTFRGALWQG